MTMRKDNFRALSDAPANLIRGKFCGRGPLGLRMYEEISVVAGTLAGARG
jgi:hypothetical protein